MSWQVHDVSYNTELCHTLLRSVWKSKMADTIWKIYHTSIWYLCLVSGCSITKEDKYCRYIVQVFNKIIKILCSILYSAHFNNIDGAMDSVVASSVIDPGFEPRSGQNPKTELVQKCMQVTWGRSVVFFGYSGFLHHRNLLPATKFSPLIFFYCQCITHLKSVWQIIFKWVIH
jgi:hypothetical protein